MMIDVSLNPQATALAIEYTEQVNGKLLAIVLIPYPPNCEMVSSWHDVARVSIELKPLPGVQIAPPLFTVTA